MFLICRVVAHLSGVSTLCHSLPLFFLQMLLVMSLVVGVGHIFHISLAVLALFGFIIVVIPPVIMSSQ